MSPTWSWLPLLTAGSAGGRLCLRESERYRRLTEERDVLRVYARSTLALHLAVRGRPLARGEEEWGRAHRSSDIGEPEGLAYKIGVFERVAREDGWRVASPCPTVPVTPPTGRGADGGSADGPGPRPTAAAHP